VISFFNKAKKVLLFFMIQLVSNIGYSQKDMPNWKLLLNNSFDKKSLTSQPFFDSICKMPQQTIKKIIEQIEDESKTNDKHSLKTQLFLTKASLSFGSGKPFEEKPWHYWGVQSLKNAIANENEWLLQTTYQMLGYWYWAALNYDTCIFFQIKSIELAEKLGYTPSVIAGWKILASNTFYYTGNYAEVIKYGTEALPYIENKTANEQVNVLNNIGMSYQQLGKYDSALYYFDKLKTIALKNKKGVWVGIAQGNFGDIYYLKGEESKAVWYWQADVDSCFKYEESDNAFLSRAFINRFNFKNGQKEKAIQQLQEAFQLTRHVRMDIKITISKILAECFEKMGLQDSAIFYNRFYYRNTDSINQIIARNKFSLVRLKLDFDKTNTEILMVKKERSTEILRRNFLLILLSLVFTLAILFYNRQRLKNKLQSQQKIIAETEAEAAKKELNLFTQLLLEKNEQIEQLNQTLSEQQQLNTDELIHKTLLTDYDWNTFKDLFEKINTGFFNRLKEAAVGITSAEMRLAALVKLNMDNKQMASMQGVSVGTIRGTKSRLRQKLSITAEEDLENFIKNI
jgi:DNA-binding CsgD family transcriptional regulator